MTVLTARDVGVRLGGNDIVKQVNLTAETGDWLSIIGPNGAGKSTLLRALAGAGRPSGTIEVDSVDIASLRPNERAVQVAWVPQSPTIPSGMSVLDYVLLGRTPHLNVLSSPKARDIVMAEGVLTDLDLIDKADRMIDTLSGGERQRAVIGRALAQEAPIMLLDEPTSALDLGHQQDVLRLLDRLRAEAGRTIISTMHDLTLAGMFADRLLLLSDGRVAAEGTAAEVLTEQNISTHYRADVHITHRGDAVLVAPRIDRPDSPRTQENTDGN